eukprot:5446375-Pyramimonas_sp.AAC.1
MMTDGGTEFEGPFPAPRTPGGLSARTRCRALAAKRKMRASRRSREEGSDQRCTGSGAHTPRRNRRTFVQGGLSQE